MLKAAGQHGPLDGSDDYYTAWVAALETMLRQKGMANDSLLAAMKANWTAVFLATPHGQSVHPEMPPALTR